MCTQHFIHLIITHYNITQYDNTILTILQHYIMIYAALYITILQHYITILCSIIHAALLLYMRHYTLLYRSISNSIYITILQQ